MVIKYNRRETAPLLAEFLGTAVLVMVALVLAQTTGVPYFIATSVAVTLGLVYVLFGSVSGGHFNPAVTLGMWSARRISTVRGIGYLASQMLGGFAAWQLFQYFTNQSLPAKVTHWSTPMFLAELVGTAILAIGFTAAMMRKLDTLTSALAYGASFFVGIMVAATASAGYLNPASALAMRNFNWVYILGPVVGGIVGVNLYMYLFPVTKDSKK